jgi:NitT/TauT family transport system permease protein
VENRGELLTAAAITLSEAALGLAIAAAVAFLITIACFYKPGLLAFLMPVMVSSQVIPLIVLAPFMIIALGSGMSSKVAMAGIIAFFPIFINFSAGYAAINKNVIELLDIYDAPKKFRIFRVYFPLSTQNIFAGLKISSTLAVIGAIVAEFAGAERGLGKNLLLTSTRIEPELLINSLVLSALSGGFLYSLISITERRVGRWYLNAQQP